MICPEAPSTRRRCPVCRRCVARSTPTTAGMPYSRATTEPSTRSHQPADLHHQPARREEERGPRRVGAGAHQNLAGGQLRSMGIEDHAHRALDHTRRDRAAHNDVAVRAGRRSAPRKSSAHRSAASAGSAGGVFRARRRPAARRSARPNGLRYPQVGGTRTRLENGILPKRRKCLKNAANPTCRVHAVLGGVESLCRVTVGMPMT